MASLSGIVSDVIPDSIADVLPPLPDSAATTPKHENRPDTPPRPKTRRFVWESRWADLPIYFGALLLLLAWLVTAAWLAAVRKVLPSDYFADYSPPGFARLTAGDRDLTMGDYNTVINIAASLAATVIALAIAIGFKHVLRELTRRPDGLSLDHYTALNKLSIHAPLFHWRPVALCTIVVFVLITFFDAATQAAFGASIAYYTLPDKPLVPRLNENPTPLTSLLETSLDEPGDLNDAVSKAYGGLLVNAANALAVTVDGVSLVASEFGDPLIAVQYLSNVLSNVILPTSTLQPTPHQIELLNASEGGSLASSVSEGFTVTANCAPATALTTSFTSSDDLVFINITNLCPSPIELPYSTADLAQDGVIYDFWGCGGEQSTVNVLQVLPSTTAATAALNVLTCTLSAESALYESEFDSGSGEGTIKRDAMDATPIATKTLGAINDFAGVIFWNTFGVGGCRDLRTGIQAVQGQPASPYANSAFRDVANTTVATVFQVLLVKLANALQSEINTNGTDDHGWVTSAQDTAFELLVISIHLRGARFVWLLLPVGLFILLVGLLIFRFRWPTTGGGRLDFTDPLQVTLNALASGLELDDVPFANDVPLARYHDWDGPSGKRRDPEGLTVVNQRVYYGSRPKHDANLNEKVRVNSHPPSSSFAPAHGQTPPV